MNIFKVISLVPLFLVLLAIYFIVAIAGGSELFTDAGGTLFTMNLVSGAEWTLTWSHIFIILGVITLYIELVKSTSTGTATVIEHGLSMFTFILYFALFLLVKPAGNSTFFVLSLMSLLDVVAGFTITIVAARRDFAVGGPAA